jgi:hypothetical protein
MFTVSRLAKSSLLVLLAATLTTAAYAREGGGGGGGGGHNGSNGPSGPSMQIHVSPVLSNARIDPGNGGPIWSKDPVAHGYTGQPGKTTPVVRDHRGTNFPGDPVPNTCPATCCSNCVGEGGLGYGTAPGPGNGYKPRDGQVNDHRTGSGPVVHDHRSSGPVVTIKFP